MSANKTRSDRMADERERRCQEIKDSAMRLFENKGYAGTTIDDIAKDLGYGKASLYYYFKNKEEIFVSIVFDNIDKLVNDMDDMGEAPDPAVVILGRVVDHFVDERFQKKGIFQVFHQIQTFFSEIGDDQTRGIMFGRLGRIMQGITDLVTKAMEQGDVSPGDPRQLAGIFLGLIFGVVFFTGGPVVPVANEDQEAFRTLLRTIILRGLAPGHIPGGIK